MRRALKKVGNFSVSFQQLKIDHSDGIQISEDERTLQAIVKEGLREALYYQCNHSTVFPLCAVEVVVVVILLASSSSNSVRGAEQQMFAVWYGRGEQNDDIFQQQQPL